MLTVMLGAEGCSELTGEPWIRDATDAEVVAFKEKHDMTAAIFRNMLEDNNGRPYFLKTLEHDAPEWAKKKAQRFVRCLRLTE